MEPSGSRGGRNYGWRIFEGSHPFDVPVGYDTSTLTAPVIEYSHEFGQSIIGGFVYRGPPSRLSGIYFYADFSAPKVWGARREGGLWVTQVIDTSFRQFSSFGEGETGRLYGADDYQGKIFEISEDWIVRAPVLSPAGAVYKNDQVVTCLILRAGRTPTARDPGPRDISTRRCSTQRSFDLPRRCASMPPVPSLFATQAIMPSERSLQLVP